MLARSRMFEKETQIQFSHKPIISVRVLFFGAVADVLGIREDVVELYAGSTVGDVHASYLSSNHKLERLKIKYAVDQQYCSGMHMLADGEEVALFTSVSGG